MATKRKTKRTKKAGTAPKTGNSIISSDYRREHKPDAFATALRAAVEGDDGKIDTEKLKAVCAENGIEFKYAHLNPGQQFVNCSNRLRARVKRGEPVTIGGKPFKSGGRS